MLSNRGSFFLIPRAYHSFFFRLGLKLKIFNNYCSDVWKGHMREGRRGSPGFRRLRNHQMAVKPGK